MSTGAGTNDPLDGLWAILRCAQQAQAALEAGDLQAFAVAAGQRDQLSWEASPDLTAEEITLARHLIAEIEVLDQAAISLLEALRSEAQAELDQLRRGASALRGYGGAETPVSEPGGLDREL